METNQLAPGVVRVVINKPGFLGVTGAGYLAEIQFQAVGSVGESAMIQLTLMQPISLALSLHLRLDCWTKPSPIIPLHYC